MIISRRRLQPSSFTLIEMLTVIAIIAILASLILWAGEALMLEADRSRAHAEVAGMGQALENYKVDNGTYPTGTNFSGPPYTSLDPSAVAGSYQLSSEALYLALSGQTNFTDQPSGVNKCYYAFKATQVGNPAGTPNTSYVQDPFGFSYGYSTGVSGSTPYNGTGLYDLWSTGGTTGTTTSNPNPTNSWITNWKN